MAKIQTDEALALSLLDDLIGLIARSSHPAATLEIYASWLTAPALAYEDVLSEDADHEELAEYVRMHQIGDKLRRFASDLRYGRYRAVDATWSNPSPNPELVAEFQEFATKWFERFSIVQEGENAVKAVNNNEGDDHNFMSRQRR